MLIFKVNYVVIIHLIFIRQNFLFFIEGKFWKLWYIICIGGVRRMNIKYINVDKLLILELTEEIDHHTSKNIKRRMDYEIERYMPKKVVFDFSGVSFMDSSGIGLLLR